MAFDSKNPKIDFVRMALTLFAIAAVVATLLALVNHVTEPIIEGAARDRLDQSLQTLAENASSFEALDAFEESVVIGKATVPVRAVYQARNYADESLGYCVYVAPNGYSDVIEMIVSIDAEGAVNGVQILSISDTPGIGMKVESDAAFRKSVYGLTDGATVVKTAPKGKGEIQAISGATVSSTAYINGVNAALKVVQKLNQEVQE